MLSCSSEDSNSHSRELVKSLWYENVIQGSHLAEVRRLQSYICGGKSDWSKDLAKINKNRSKKNDSASRQRLQLRGKRLSLLEARDRAFKGSTFDVLPWLNPYLMGVAMFFRYHRICEPRHQVEQAAPVVSGHGSRPNSSIRQTNEQRTAFPQSRLGRFLSLQVSMGTQRLNSTVLNDP